MSMWFYIANCICVRVWDRGVVLYGSNYWRGPSDTHSASHTGPECVSLPLFLFFLSLPHSLSLFFCLSVSTSLSPFPFFSHCTKLLSYEPQQRGKVKPPFRGNRNLCDILIQITYFQFAQTSPENTKPIRLNLMSWLRRCFCAYMCLCCMTKGHLRLRTLPPSGPCCVRLARTRNTAI